MTDTVSIEVLVEPGQTPSGFGLALHEWRYDGEKESVWGLRPLSPCCGEFIIYGGPHCDELVCDSCSRSWQAFADDCNGTIGNNVPVGTSSTSTSATNTLARWFARIMQYPNAEGNHDVKVSIEWS